MRVDWLLDCEPREVQLEALRRSYYGTALRGHRDDEGTERFLHPGQRRGWGHFMEMRLGKTPTAINEWLLYEQEHGVNRLVVFTPNSYKYSWVGEFQKFGVAHPAVPLDLGRSLGATKRNLEKTNSPVALVVNYEAMQHESGRRAVAEFIDGRQFGAVFDESIKLKNPNSTQTKACVEISKTAAFTRPMTGRPMTQGPHDLYTQLRLSGLYEGMAYEAFKSKYCKKGGFKNKQVVGTKNEESLQRAMAKGTFVAKRKDWSDTVKPEYIVDTVPMEPEQLVHYESMKKDFYVMVEDNVIDVDQVITQWMKLQQITSGFVYDQDKKTKWLLPINKVPKMARLLQVMDETDSKVVVAFHFKPSGEALAEALKQYDPAFIFSRQWMDKNNRNYDDEKARFNKSRKCRLMLGQLDAMKYGHDLTGNPEDRTHLFFFYENSISLDTRGQVEARIQAAQQDWGSYYMDIISSEIDQKFIDALIHKQTLEEMVMGSYGNRRWLTNE